jgi:NADH-quinone oxidoreductase subunit I
MPQKLPWEDWKEGDDLHTSAWVRATSPAGAAEMEGRVMWSGELGYGVRPPQPGQSDPQSDDVPADTDVSLREISSAALRGIGVSDARPTRSTGGPT